MTASTRVAMRTYWQAVRARVTMAAPAAVMHLAITAVVAAVAAALVLLVWYPGPYAELSGGGELFLLLVGVDIVCGPLLTLVLFDRKKPRAELVRDLGLVVAIQVLALSYGMHTSLVAKPLYLVHEVDRFRVIAQPDFLGADVQQDIESLPDELRPTPLSGPRVVGTRKPRNSEEQMEVVLQALNGGRDVAQRPDFYVPYDGAYALYASARAKPLMRFVERNPNRADELAQLLRNVSVPMPMAKFLPVVHRQDWIVVLGPKGQIVGFAPGDGFAIP